MIRTPYPLALAATLLMAAPAAAQTARFQDTAQIDIAVAQFTGKAIGQEGGARTVVDTRLKLAACAMPQFEWRGASRDAVVVRCMAPVWRIFVPVTMPPPIPAPVIAVTAPVPVAVKPVIVIKRGDPITVEAGSAGFSITRDGVAVTDAAVGARLLVRVDDKKPPIQAVAVESGRARLPGWGQ